jgi:spore coat polysaccharide biosynthesis protein SpsF
MGSHRLPGKALLPINGLPMIVFLIKRLKQSEKIHRFILATTTLKEDNQLVSEVKKEKVNIFRGQCDDVVSRYIDAADRHKLDYVVRVTGDCPLVDGQSLDHCIELCERLNDFDLASTKGYFPVGIDFEIYKAKSMKVLSRSELTRDEREHLTLGFYNRKDKFTLSPLLPPEHWPPIVNHLTVDTEADYHFIQSIVDFQKNTLIDIPTILRKVQNQKRI